jgi:peptide/nickel transport system permease protein
MSSTSTLPDKLQRPVVEQDSLLKTTTRATLKPWLARIGLGWVLLLAGLGFYGPLLANSHPYLMKDANGVISSPMLKFLTPWDVILMVGPIVLLLGWLAAKLMGGKGLVKAIVLVALGLLMMGSFLWVKPPPLVVYESYREGIKDGKIAWAIRAPIPYSPSDRQRDDMDAAEKAPSATHWLGTEGTGADVASQMVHSCRVAVSIGFVATGIAAVIGIVLGGLMGYFAGWVDLLGMRLVEVFSAIPTMYLLLTFIAAFETRNIYLIMTIIGLTSWQGYTMFVRAEFLKLRNMDFVHGCTAAGLPLYSTLFKHMLPNALAPVLVSMSFGIASAVTAEASLSFLGLGAVDSPSWGALLNQSVKGAGGFYWWLAIYPGGAIFLTVFAYNVLGESLRDALDPRTQ